MFSLITRKLRERRLEAKAQEVFANWREAREAYLARQARRDTRGQHEAWPAVRDSMNARLRLEVGGRR